MQNDLATWDEAARTRLHRAARAFGTQEQLSAATGIPVPTLQKILKGDGDPSISRIALIASALGRPVDYFLTGISDESGDWETQLAMPFQTRVPQYEGHVSAGDGGSVFEGEPIDYLSFPTDWLKRMGDPREMHIITVRGDSMEPELRSDDIVIVDCSQRSPREGIFAFNVDGWALVKRLRMKGQGGADLVSTNPAYPPIAIALDQEHLIAGRVVWTGRHIA